MARSIYIVFLILQHRNIFSKRFLQTNTTQYQYLPAVEKVAQMTSKTKRVDHRMTQMLEDCTKVRTVHNETWSENS